MTDLSAMAAAVFRTTLPIGAKLLVIFVPSKDRQGQPINQDHWVDEVLSTLGRLYRGGTAYPRGRGVWRDDTQEGKLIFEEPVIVFVYAAELHLTLDSLQEINRTLCRMGKETNQGEVGLVLDGKYYGITHFEVT